MLVALSPKSLHESEKKTANNCHVFGLICLVIEGSMGSGQAGENDGLPNLGSGGTVFEMN